MLIDEATEDNAAIINAVHDLTLDASVPVPLGDVEHLFGVTVPTSAVHKVIDLEGYAAHPRRKKAHPTFTETESLAAYVNIHRTDGTTLYANPDDVSVVANIDDHAKDDAGHRDHIATLRLQRTPGCERWLKAHGQYLEQVAFAQLVEDGLTEIARPDGAELLEVAQSISATKNASFRSDRRLANGRVQFAWHEDIDATAGQSGELQIPDTITLVFEPFYGAQRVQIDARFRYRIRDGKLTLGVWLIRHEETLRDAFKDELDRLREMLDGANAKPTILAGSA